MLNRTPILIFDWGDTIMRDLNLPGAMKDWPRVEWVTGAREMLEVISMKYISCIATSALHSDTADLIAALNRVGADKYFKHFYSSSDLGASKPDPRFFALIVDSLGADPKECVSIGNLYEKDIIPAKMAGLSTVWFNEKNIIGNFPKADKIIHHWKQLPGVLPEYTR